MVAAKCCLNYKAVLYSPGQCMRPEQMLLQCFRTKCCDSVCCNEKGSLPDTKYCQFVRLLSAPGSLQARSHSKAVSGSSPACKLT